MALPRWHRNTQGLDFLSTEAETASLLEARDPVSKLGPGEAADPSVVALL